MSTAAPDTIVLVHGFWVTRSGEEKAGAARPAATSDVRLTHAGGPTGGRP